MNRCCSNGRHAFTGVVLFAMFILQGFSATAQPISATVEWSDRSVLSTPVSGIIDQVLVVAGQRINKGDLLMSLNSEPFLAEVQIAQARVQQLKEDYLEAVRELERSEELFDRTVLSVHDLQLVKIDLTRAQAQYNAAQAHLRRAQYDLKYSQIQAPFSGIVVQVMAHPGQLVVTRTQAQPLLVLAAHDKMLARAQISLDQVATIQIGQLIKLEVLGRSVEGEIVSIALEPIDEKNGSPLYQLDVEFPFVGFGQARAGIAVLMELP